MTADSDTFQPERVPFVALVPFLLVAFGVAWGLVSCYIFLPEQMTTRFGEISGSRLCHLFVCRHSTRRSDIARGGY